ncbi:MAG TPA: hypothetical protein VFE47_12110 [Tepidisphaeraceae bacterium]|nr:hypothetical protein [Tepidisphaeraceae bacterium]
MHVAPAATQPAADPAGAAAATTQPADPKAAAAERHKRVDPRWRQMIDSQRNNMRARWADAPIKQTFAPGALISLSLENGLLKAQTTDLATAAPIRVAIEGNKDVWMLARPRIAAAGAFAASGNYVTLTRFNFDAKDEEPWQARMLMTDRTTSFTSQSQYGITSLSQSNGAISLHVSEYTELGKPQNILCAAQASSLEQLRAEHADDFRMYAIPLLQQFCDTSFLQPGAADVYSVFVKIPADMKVTQEVQQLVPQLDADDPADREAASAKLRQLGPTGVLAALRLDESALTEEQKLRLRALISGSRRLPVADPAAQRHNLNFLIDCLEYDDIAVRQAAKAELANQTHQSINFDASATGNAAVSQIDALRKQLLTESPATQPALPATQPAPQV